MKRITFSKEDAGYLYELAFEHFCNKKDNCWRCDELKSRLEKFIGEKETKFVKSMLKKNGYCKPIKETKV